MARIYGAAHITLCLLGASTCHEPLLIPRKCQFTYTIPISQDTDKGKYDWNDGHTIYHGHSTCGGGRSRKFCFHCTKSFSDQRGFTGHVVPAQAPKLKVVIIRGVSTLPSYEKLSQTLT